MSVESFQNSIAQEFARGNLEQALKMTERFLEEFPGHPFGWKALAAIMIQSGRLDEARASVVKAIAINEGDADNWVNLGNLERAAGKPGEAIRCYGKAIALQANFSTAKINLATVLSETGETRQAIELLHKELLASPNLTTAHLTLGNIYKQSGAYKEAERCYEAALSIQKDYFEALLNLSSIFREQGHHEKALQYCKAAIAQRPSSAMAHSNLGNIFAAMRKPTAAIDAYQTALQLEPGFIEAQVNLSNILRQTGNIESAIRLCRAVLDSGTEHLKARLNLCFCLFERRDFSAAGVELAILLARDRNNASALVLSGLIASEQGRCREAIQRAAEALAISVQDPYVQLGAGSIHASCGQVTAAEIHFREAIRLDPNSPEAHLNLANLLLPLGRYAEALNLVSKAIDLFPELAQGHATRALILRDLRHLQEAGTAAAIAIELRPDLPQIQSAMGLIKLDLGAVVEASKHLLLALENDPDNWIAQLNYANALREIGRHEQSIELYRQALRSSVKPELALQNPENRSLIIQDDHRAQPQAASNYLLALNYHSRTSDKEIYNIARSIAPLFGYHETQLPSSRPMPFTHDWCPGSSLRIGFVSGDLKEHPVGYFTEGLFENLSKAGHLLFAYPTTPADDGLTKRIRKHFFAWRPIYGASDEHAAGLIAEDRVDALIDLAGHTAANRLGIFARRPAPVQLTWLGYCGTTGLSEMDYIIADEVAIPELEEVWYSERVIRIEGSYACLASLPDVTPGARPPMLDQGYCTFGSFNNLAKIDLAVVKAWAKILLRDEAFKLFLKSKQFADPGARRLIVEAMLAEGVNENQLLFEAADKRQTYLKAYERVDLALDPFPYPGFTTSIEALWMGVPVLTMKGKRFIQRNGEIVLKQIELSEWIASDEHDYVERAINFAQNPAELSKLRTSLRGKLASSPLTDIATFSMKFAAILKDVCSGTKANQ